MVDDPKAPGAAESAGDEYWKPKYNELMEENVSLIMQTLELKKQLDALPPEADPETCPPGCAELEAQSREIREKLARGEISLADAQDLLAAQMFTLDGMFQRVLQRSYLDTVSMIHTDRLRVALLAQRQCAATLRALQTSRFPKTWNFAERTEESDNSL